MTDKLMSEHRERLIRLHNALDSGEKIGDAMAARYAESLRAILAASAGQAEPIYEQRIESRFEVSWRRVAKDRFDALPEDQRRIVYAAPTPAAAQDAQAKDDRYTEGYDDGMANARELLSDMRVKADDHRRLVRELDVLLNGEEGAAKQASLCDVVAQVRREGIRSVQHKGDEAQDERGAFEVWFIQESRRGKTILGAWDGWQARAAASPVSGAPGDVLAERIRTKLHSIRAKTGNALFDAGVHDACEKIESLLAEIERGERAGEK